jgi:hypothetical protein
MTALTALRTLLALTASKARVTWEMFLTLRMRIRISRDEDISYPCQVLAKVSKALVILVRSSSESAFFSMISLPISGWEEAM